jgi:hypothetical protein
MDEIKPIDSKGKPYKVQVDEQELARRVDLLSFVCFTESLPRDSIHW